MKKQDPQIKQFEILGKFITKKIDESLRTIDRRLQALENVSRAPGKAKGKMDTALIGQFIEKKIAEEMEDIDKDIETLFNRVESGTSKKHIPLPPVKGGGDISKRLQEIEEDVEELRNRLPSENLKELEKDILDHFKSIDKQLKENMSAQKKFASQSEKEIDAIRRMELKDVKGSELQSVSKQVSEIATKLQWLEMEIERHEIKPLQKRVSDLERRISEAAMAGPYVIE